MRAACPSFLIFHGLGSHAEARNRRYKYVVGFGDFGLGCAEGKATKIDLFLFF
jgi:hypothetical protein